MSHQPGQELQERPARRYRLENVPGFGVKSPDGEEFMPRKHPGDRGYTVISGVFHIGLDDDFDASKLESARSGDRSPRVHVSFPLGTIRRMHTQVNAIGLLGLDYVSAQGRSAQ